MFKKYQLRSYNFRLVILLIVTSVYGIAVINSADSSYTIKQCAGSHCTDFNAAKSFNNHFAGINFVYHYILCRLKLPDYGHCFIVYSACHHYSGYLYQ